MVALGPEVRLCTGVIPMDRPSLPGVKALDHKAKTSWNQLSVPFCPLVKDRGCSTLDPDPNLSADPGEKARSWGALGEARPGQSSLSAGALRYHAWAQMFPRL